MITTDLKATPAALERTGLQERSGPSIGMKILAGLMFFLAALGLLGFMAYHFYFKSEATVVAPVGENPGAPISAKVEPKPTPLDAPPDLTVATDKPCPPGIVCDPTYGATSPKARAGKGQSQINIGEMSEEDITVRAARIQKAEEENSRVLSRRLGSALGRADSNGVSDARDNANSVQGAQNVNGQTLQQASITPQTLQTSQQQNALFAPPALINTSTTVVPPLLMTQGSDASEQSNNPLAQQLSATSTPRARAAISRNPSLTIHKGQSGTCVLDTALSSEQIGFVSCVADFPVKSSDGKVTLLGRGTRYDGEYKKGVERGSSSSFVLWTTAKTPEGVTIDLLSPATDALGRPGVPGQIESRFWERFKGALMFSVVQDGLQLLTQRAAGKASGSNVFVMPANTTNAGVGAVNEVMKRDADIKDALITHQGTIIGITFARDLDFTSVYKLTHQPRY